MNRTSMLAFVGSFGIAGSIVATATSCADSTETNARAGTDAGSNIPAPADSAPDGALTANDGGCDAGTLGCEATPPTCDDGAWCPVSTPLDPRLGLAAVWGTSKTNVWAVGSGGTILHFDGTAWSAIPSGTAEAIYAIGGSGPTDLWAVSSTQKVFRGSGYANGTASWTLTTPLADFGNYAARGKIARAIWATSSTDVMVGGESFASSWSEPPANRWRASVADGVVTWTPASDCVSDYRIECPSILGLWGSGNGERWAVGTNGHAARATATDDAGAPVWTPLDSQSTDDLQAVSGSGNGDVWVVGEHGTIRHHASGADRLGVIESPTSEALRSVWAASPNDAWAVGDNGTILHFDGSAWTPAAVTLPAGAKPNLRGIWGSSSNDVWAVGNGIVLHFTGPATGKKDSQ